MRCRGRGCLGIAALLLVIAGGCDKAGASGAPPGNPRRAAVPRRGQQLAGDPNPAPPIADVLGPARLIPVGDGVHSGWHDELAGKDTMWIGPMIDHLDDGKSGRNALAVRREAFGSHVPAAGETREIDDDELVRTGYADDARLVLLVGAERQCIAQRGRARVIAVAVGGHVLDLRWALEGCGAGPWAPIGLIADRIPGMLRWRASACPEPREIEAAWAEARPATTGAGWTEMGAFVLGDDPVALLAHDGDAGVMLLAPAIKGGRWRSRSFDTAELTAIRHGCEPTPAEPEPQ